MIAPSRGGQGEARAADRPTGPKGPGDQQAPPNPHPLEPLLKQIAILREFTLHYIEAQKDQAKATVRRLVINVAMGIVAAIIGATLLIVSTILVADGLAELISVALGGRPWAGKLILGGGLLVLFGLVAAIIIARLRRAERRRIIRKYESRHHAQRAKFGSDVTQRAAL